jgi:hypothetical protein
VFQSSHLDPEVPGCGDSKQVKCYSRVVGSGLEELAMMGKRAGMPLAWSPSIYRRRN